MRALLELAVTASAIGVRRPVPMTKNSSSYRVADLPPARRGTRNYLDLYWWKHSIYGLLEVDVTRARQLIEEHEA
jgi:hypothetical protein